MNKGLHAVRVKRFSALAPPPLGTVLYYPGLPGFGSTIIDRSGKENHGAITGATWTRLPSGLMGLNFASNYVSLPINPFGTANGTVKAWGRMSSGVGTANQRLFGVARSNGTASKGTIGHDGAESDTWQFAFNYGAGWKSLTGGVTPTVNVFYHVVGTWGAAGMKLYVNGVQIAGDVTYTGIPDGTPDAFFVGCHRNTVEHWAGLIALEVVSNAVWDDYMVANSYRQERHLFNIGV